MYHSTHISFKTRWFSSSGETCHTMVGWNLWKSRYGITHNLNVGKQSARTYEAPQVSFTKHCIQCFFFVLCPNCQLSVGSTFLKPGIWALKLWCFMLAIVESTFFSHHFVQRCCFSAHGFPIRVIRGDLKLPDNSGKIPKTERSGWRFITWNYHLNAYHLH